MRKYTLLFVWLLIMISNLAVAQTWSWTGNESDDWQTAGNWSQGSIPGASSIVAIPATLASDKPWPRLTGEVSIERITINGTVEFNGYGITTSQGLNTISGATLKNSGPDPIRLTINGTSGTTTINQSKIEAAIVIMLNENTALNEGTTGSSEAFNQYEEHAAFVINSDGNVSISQTRQSVYKGGLKVERTVSGTTTLFNAGAAITGDFEYKNVAGGNTTIGNTANPTAISGRADVLVDAECNPNFNLYGVTNQGSGGRVWLSRPGTLNIANTSLVADMIRVSGKKGGYSEIRHSLFTGTFSYADSTGNDTELRIYNNTFNGDADFTFKGTGVFNESYNSSSTYLNTYKGDVLIVRSGTGDINIGVHRPVIFEKSLAVTRTAPGATNILSNGGSIGADFAYTNTGGGVTTIGATGTTIPVTGEINILTDSDGHPTFSLNGLQNQENGGRVWLSRPGTINIANASLVADLIRVSGKHGAYSEISHTTFTGTFSYADSTGNDTELRIYNNTFDGDAVFTFKGTGVFNESYNSTTTYQSTYKGNVLIARSGTGDINIGLHRPVIFEKSLAVTRTAPGATNILPNGGSIGANFAYTNTGGGVTAIGAAATTISVTGEINILTDSNGHPTFSLNGLRNQENGGRVWLSRPGAVNIANASLVADMIRVSGKHGAYSEISHTTFTGTFSYADSTQNDTELRIYNNTFDGDADFTFKGTGVFNESYNSSSTYLNTYKGDVLIARSGTGDINIGVHRPVIFEKSLAVTRTAPGATNILSNGGSIGANFAYTNTGGGVTTIGAAGTTIPVTGEINILTDSDGHPTFSLNGLRNQENGGRVWLSRPGAVNIANASLVADMIRVSGKHGAYSEISHTTFTGTFSYADSTQNDTELRIYNNTFNGDADFTFKGTGVFNESYNSTTGYQNTYLGNASFTHNGSGALALAVHRIPEFHKSVSIKASSAFSFSNPLRFAGTTDGIFTVEGGEVVMLPGIILNKDHNAKLILDNPVDVTGQVTLSKGYIQTSETSYLNFAGSGAVPTQASDESHVIGPVRKTGINAFTFPVGNGVTYHPVSISAPGSPSHVFSAEYKAADLVNYDPGNVEDPLEKVSDHGYWDVQRLTGNNGVFLKLAYKVPAGFITQPNDLRVAHWDEAWKNLGGTIDGTNTEGTVETENAVTDFSPFALATINFEANPLPVKLAAFTVTKEGNSAILNWTTTEETGSHYFQAERSTDGRKWQPLGQVKAAGSSEGSRSYTFTDTGLPALSLTYYRLKMIDSDGSYAYSDIRSLVASPAPGISLTVYPNPASDYVLIQSSAPAPISSIDLLDFSGRQLNSPANKSSDTVDVSTLQPGVYFVRIYYTDGASASSRFVITR